MITPDQIYERKKKQPFKPFRIITEDGSYDVKHAQLILVGQQDCMVGFPSKVDPTCYEHVSRVAIQNIKAIEDLPVSNPSDESRQG